MEPRFILPSLISCRPHQFSGREAILADIGQHVLAGKREPIVLFAPFRAGKSSVVESLPHRLDGQIISADCDMCIARDKQHANVATKRISEKLKERGIDIEPLSLTGEEADMSERLYQWFRKVNDTLGERRLLFSMDEALGWESDKMSVPLLENYKNILHSCPQISLCFVSVRPFDETSVLKKYFPDTHLIKLGRFSREEASDLIDRACSGLDMKCSDMARELILRETGCHPCMLTNFLRELNSILEDNPSKGLSEHTDIKLCNIVKAIVESQIALGGVFPAMVRIAMIRTGDAGKVMLEAIVKGEIPADDPVTRQKLIDSLILTEEGEFAVPMFRRYFSYQEMGIIENNFLSKVVARRTSSYSIWQ